MVTVRKPSPGTIQLFLAKQAAASYAYPELGATNTDAPVPGYDNDRSQVLLGSGPAVYDAACLALRQWRMFPGGWAWIVPPAAPIQTGQTLAMVARTFGLHWANGCRIVYTLDGSGPERRYGFAPSSGKATCCSWRRSFAQRSLRRGEGARGFQTRGAEIGRAHV